MFMTKSVLEPRANPHNKLKIFTAAGIIFIYRKGGGSFSAVSPLLPPCSPLRSAVFSLVPKILTKKLHQSNALIANRIFKSFLSENTQTIFRGRLIYSRLDVFLIRGHVEGKVKWLPTRMLSECTQPALCPPSIYIKTHPILCLERRGLCFFIPGKGNSLLFSSICVDMSK